MKVGLVSSYPPIRCGIGTYTAHIARTLSTDGEGTVVHVAAEEGSRPRASEKVAPPCTSFLRSLMMPRSLSFSDCCTRTPRALARVRPDRRRSLSCRVNVATSRRATGDIPRASRREAFT